MKALLTGGTGYIGSHTVHALRASGHRVVVIDRKAPSHATLIADAPFVLGDITDRVLVDKVLGDHDIDAVVHIAADKSVDESMRDPTKYFDNNTGGTLSVLAAMQRRGVSHLVFSSSCSVYGTPDANPIIESTPPHPESPYGESKLLSERMLRWFDECHAIRSMSLRYFNVAGASLDGSIGEDWSGSTNLIPVVIKATLGLAEPIKVFGTDYPTPDGTAIRDYIHVVDLAEAHVRALDHLERGGRTDVLNIGTGRGASVREVIRTVEDVSGRPVPHELVGRRAGDPSAVWADTGKARRTLGWEPTFGLREIIETAWRWHASQPSDEPGPG